MSDTIRLTMAQALLRFLDAQYVCHDNVESKYIDSIFGIFGHGCALGIGQGLQESDQNMRLYQGHNEQNMAHAAIAYGKEHNRKIIIPCVSSIGPGALNMVTAAGTATANRLPLLLLVGDTFASRQPDPVLQQVEHSYDLTMSVNDAFKSVSRFWDRVVRPEQVMSSLMNAMRVLTDVSETGAVTLALPQDTQAESYDYPLWFFEKRVWEIDRQLVSKKSVDNAVELIKSAKKPYIIVGGGVRYSEAGVELAEFCEKFNIPFGETQAGKGTISSSHPYNLGGIGVTGSKSANIVAQDADLIIAVGTKLGDFTTGSKSLFNSYAKILSINVSKMDVIKMNATWIQGDAKIALLELMQHLGTYKASYTHEIEDAKNEWKTIVDDLYSLKSDYGFTQTEALGIINNNIAKDSIVVGSSGSLPGDLQRVWRVSEPGTYHVEYGFSCMGYEVNGALGAKMADPSKEVYSMCGDGSYLMGHSEIYTSIQEHMKINVMLFDNNGYGCIENLQHNHGSETFGTVFKYRNPETQQLDGDNVPIDFAKNAESFGCKAYRIYSAQDLIDALIDSKTQTRTCLFDIKVLPQTMTHGYNSWWNVGVSDVSSSESVLASNEVINTNRKAARKY